MINSFLQVDSLITRISAATGISLIQHSQVWDLAGEEVSCEVSVLYKGSKVRKRSPGYFSKALWIGRTTPVEAQRIINSLVQEIVDTYGTTSPKVFLEYSGINSNEQGQSHARTY